MKSIYFIFTEKNHDAFTNNNSMYNTCIKPTVWLFIFLMTSQLATRNTIACEQEYKCVILTKKASSKNYLRVAFS